MSDFQYFLVNAARSLLRLTYENGRQIDEQRINEICTTILCDKGSPPKKNAEQEGKCVEEKATENDDHSSKHDDDMTDSLSVLPESPELPKCTAISNIKTKTAQMNSVIPVQDEANIQDYSLSSSQTEYPEGNLRYFIKTSSKYSSAEIRSVGWAMFVYANYKNKNI